MDKANLPFSASVLDALQPAHPAGTSFPKSLPRLITTPSWPSSKKTSPVVGVDSIAVVGGRRMIRLMVDLNENYGLCGSCNGGEEYEPGSNSAG